MLIEEFEIRWRVGAVTHTLKLGADGAPRTDARPLGGGWDDAAYGPDDPYCPACEDLAAHARYPSIAPAARATPPRAPKPARTGQPWSEDDEAKLRAGHAAGKSADELAEELGRTRGAVRVRQVVLGLVAEESAGLRYPVKRDRPAGEAVGEGDGGDAQDPAGELPF